MGISYTLRKRHKICILKICLRFTIALLVAVLCRTPPLIMLALNNVPNQNIFIYLTQMDEPPPPPPPLPAWKKTFCCFPSFPLGQKGTPN